eukprot:2897430-Amphidinium_carterae.1
MEPIRTASDFLLELCSSPPPSQAAILHWGERNSSPERGRCHLTKISSAGTASCYQATPLKKSRTDPRLCNTPPGTNH